MGVGEFCVYLCHPPSWPEVSEFSPILIFCYVVIAAFHYSHPGGCEVATELCVVLICVYLMTNVTTLVNELLGHLCVCVHIFEKWLVKILAHFKTGLSFCC